MTIGGIGQPETSPISRSAMMNATSIAIMNRDPALQAVLDDPFAEWFATGISDEARTVIQGLQTPAQCRELIARIESENVQPGISTHHLYRKPWVTRRVRDALRAGARQMVILGAGLDTLALRLEEELRGMPCFEVDTPTVIDYRRACIEAHRGLPEGVRLVAIDFEKERLDERLREAGYEPDVPSVFLAEGVMEWLPEQAVLALFALIRGRGEGTSRFIFSFMPPTAHSDRRYAHIRDDNAQSGESWKFAISPHALPGFLHEQGFELLDSADPELFRRERSVSSVPFDVLDFLHFAYARAINQARQPT